jgi:LmbE family N-acetylglucosaminyl deacetylase
MPSGWGHSFPNGSASLAFMAEAKDQGTTPGRRFGRAMVVFAHPDDAEFGTAGTIAAWTRAGTEVAYVSVTDGSAGSNEPGSDRDELARIREAEQRAACEVLGVKDVSFLGWRDGYVEVTLDLRKAITREVRRFRPDVLIAPDPVRFWDDERTYINHADHRAVGIACLNVVNPDAPTRPQFPELQDEGLQPFEIANLWIGAFGGDVDTFVDITDTIEAKIEALQCHRSQIHDWPVGDWVRARAKDRGALAGVDYAESFRTFKLWRDEEKDEREK